MGAIRMLYIVGLLFVGNIAFAAVVLDVKNTTVEYSQTDIDIRCLVNETSLSTSRFFTIQLKKSSNNVVSFAKDDGISWQDFTMQNRSGVSVNASMSSTTSAYLYLAITKDGVKYPDDMGSYQCDYSYFKPTSGLVMISSEIVFVNITGFEEMTTADSPTTWTTEPTMPPMPINTTTEPTSSAEVTTPNSGASLLGNCLHQLLPLVSGCVFLAIFLPAVQ
ncbi:uncharacterized protein LOC125670955 isoform X2 [Ostrea edulis]|uniref:uncharacterized protein LOC125670955 isoform X2 n=1 Tax=Ostrea edulis TaxID=37623 RepID=UPI0024AFD634|nr:uncharacterized protein LOC125670955 isoform X2 [Ostrea edulis]